MGAERFSSLGEFGADGEGSPGPLTVEGALSGMSDAEIDEALGVYESEAIAEGHDMESAEVLTAQKARILDAAEELMRADGTIMDQDEAVTEFRRVMDSQLKDQAMAPEEFRAEAVRILRELVEMKYQM